MVGLKIAYKDPATLKPRARNPRTHTVKQIKQIAASIEQFGFVTPVLLGVKDGIIAGHGRVAAAKLLGMSDIPTVSVAAGNTALVFALRKFPTEQGLHGCACCAARTSLTKIFPENREKYGEIEKKGGSAWP